VARVVAAAVLHGDTPEVLIAEDMETLHWLIALRFVAQTAAQRLGEREREEIRAALLDERWGDAVEIWIRATDAALDVYSSKSLVEVSDVELGGAELQFTPLFQDP
jgi:hypothetical protein